jgi:hypothetical protein
VASSLAREFAWRRARASRIAIKTTVCHKGATGERSPERGAVVRGLVAMKLFAEKSAGEECSKPTAPSPT